MAFQQRSQTKPALGSTTTTITCEIKKKNKEHFVHIKCNWDLRNSAGVNGKKKPGQAGSKFNRKQRNQKFIQTKH